MEKQTGLKVNAFFASDYAGIIEGMRFNKVQVAWMRQQVGDGGGGPRQRRGVRAGGQRRRHAGLLLAPDRRTRTARCKTLDDVLKNGKILSFGIGDPNSTSGFLVPGYYVFAQNKIEPKTAFKIVRARQPRNQRCWRWPTSRSMWPPTTARTLDKLRGPPAREVAAKLRVIWTLAADPARPAGLAQGPGRTRPRRRSRTSCWHYGKADAAREKDVLKKLAAQRLQARRPTRS